MALSRHYSENNGTINKPPLHEAYTVTFVEQPSCHSLDICENKWYHLIDAQINIQNIPCEIIIPCETISHSEHPMWNKDPPPCEIIITMLCVVWLNPMLSSALCASFSLNTACLLPPQRLLKANSWQVLMRTPETYCPHMAYYFSLPLLVISPRVSF